MTPLHSTMRFSDRVDDDRPGYSPAQVDACAEHGTISFDYDTRVFAGHLG